MRSDWKVSIRRACSTLRIDRALYVYKSKRGDQAALKSRIKDNVVVPGSIQASCVKTAIPEQFQAFSAHSALWDWVGVAESLRQSWRVDGEVSKA